MLNFDILMPAMHRLQSTYCFTRPRLAATAVLLLLLSAILPVAGCGDASEANRLVGEGESLRIAATDTFRKTTAAVDTLVRSAAAGKPLTSSEVKATTDAATEDLNSALADLTVRDARLAAAEDLELNDNYRQYLALLRESNNRLSEAMSTAMEIPVLLKKEQRSLAGWNEIKAQQILSQINVMEQRTEQIYSEAETLRNRAEQIRKDNPDDFGD